MLIYIGTPLMAVGLWKREDIDRVEASLYRKIMRIGNDIPNSTVLNTMTSTRLAGGGYLLPVEGGMGRVPPTE